MRRSRIAMLVITAVAVGVFMSGQISGCGTVCASATAACSAEKLAAPSTAFADLAEVAIPEPFVLLIGLLLLLALASDEIVIVAPERTTAIFRTTRFRTARPSLKFVPVLSATRDF